MGSVNCVCTDSETESGEQSCHINCTCLVKSTTRTEGKSGLVGRNKKSASVIVRSVNRRDHPNDVRHIHSCSRHDVAADRLTSERPGGVASVSKTLTVLGLSLCSAPPPPHQTPLDPSPATRKQCGHCCTRYPGGWPKQV